MARGKQKIHQDLFGSEPAPPRKRHYLLPARDEALAHRYYFYTYHCQLRYNSVLDLLTNEFFIGENRIAEILSEGEPYLLLKSLIEERRDIKAMEALYPQWNWKCRAVV